MKPPPSRPQGSSAVSQSLLNTLFPGASSILPLQLPSAPRASAAPPPSNLPGTRKQEEPHFKLNLFFFPQAPSSHFSLESLVKPLSGISHLLHSGPHTFPTRSPLLPRCVNPSLWSHSSPVSWAGSWETPGQISPVSLSPGRYLHVRSGE